MAGFVVWLTGLSGAGKSTIANRLSEQLAARGRVPELLAGSSIEIASSGIGTRTDVLRTTTMEAASSHCPIRSRMVRTAPRKMVSKLLRQVSSDVASMLPAGGPPTLMQPPSSRSQRACAAAISLSRNCEGVSL